MLPERFAIRKGLTLVEIMAAMLVISIAVLGAMVYRYNSMQHAREGRARLVAGRVALLILENWKGIAGDEEFSPITDIGTTIPDDNLILSSGQSGFLPSGFSGVSPSSDPPHYRIVTDDVNYYALLGYKDFLNKPLRELNVRVVWRHDYGVGAITEQDKNVSLSSYVKR